MRILHQDGASCHGRSAAAPQADRRRDRPRQRRPLARIGDGRGTERSSRNGLVHGLRARKLVAIVAHGETGAAIRAHCAAVTAELAAAGAEVRHLAKTIAGAMLRASGAERLEGELLVDLASRGEPLARVILAERDARRAGADRSLPTRRRARAATHPCRAPAPEIGRRRWLCRRHGDVSRTARRAGRQAGQRAFAERTQQGKYRYGAEG